VGYGGLKGFPHPATDRTVPLSPENVFDVLNEVKPDEAVIVNESTSNTESFWQRIGLDRARSFYFPAAGALGFGIPAAVGVQLAEPGRPVIGVIGDGSANYGITGLWSAAHYRVPATFLILRNDEYGALKWFAGVLKATGLPGMDLPGIDYCAIAQGYGVPAFASHPATNSLPPWGAPLPRISRKPDDRLPIDHYSLAPPDLSRQYPAHLPKD
jgi:benzoylformate decarboxylase